ncbi:MAG: hypothetical protein ONA90_05310 [candidate division KSB1 bacterium]|nr:hypothetical protein [candidate division KSB1 bacterium]
MIKTFLIDAPVMVVIGMLYAPLERQPEQPFYRAKTFWASCRLAGLFILLAMASYILYPDWMWMYFFSTNHLGVGLQLVLMGGILLVLYLLPLIAGYSCGMILRAKSASAWWAGIISSLVVEGFLIFILWNRYSVVGTRAQFLSGNTVRLSDFHLLSAILNGGGMLLVMFGAYQWWRLRRLRD